LIVDDEEDIQELLTINLTREGYDIATAATGETALQQAQAKQPALILLDLMLPGLHGLDVCKVLKNNSKTRHIPVVMLTAKSEESDIVAGLEIGADDYITKPFSSKVLVARVRRLLRKKTEHNSDRGAIEIHDLVIDPERYEVRLKGNSISLTRSEFDILTILAKRPGRVFTRYDIVDSLYGGDYVVSDRAVDVQIAYLRKKLGTCRHYIETVRGVGYRFKDNERA